MAKSIRVWAAVENGLPVYHLLGSMREPVVVRARYRCLARAAIEALREPTEAMYEAAILTHVRENKGIEHSPHLSWQAMIDAILKEE